jgi:hypothetical protein
MDYQRKFRSLIDKYKKQAFFRGSRSARIILKFNKMNGKEFPEYDLEKPK